MVGVRGILYNRGNAEKLRSFARRGSGYLHRENIC